MTLLQVDKLALTIHGAPILNAVTFAVQEAEVFGLVGESGSGKSLTALSVMGLAPQGAALSGRVAFEGHDLLALSEPAMCAVRGRDIGMIFQEPMTSLNPMQRIGDQVAETLIVHGQASRAQARKVAVEKLARCGLPPERFSLGLYPHELSGGQRQRVSIAMAIALRPRLLIADEPTTALDVTTQAQILDLLKGLVREDRMALMLITHDLAVVAGIADHVAVMQAGAIVEQGATEPLFRTRSHDYTRRLFAASAHSPVRKPQTRDKVLLQVKDAVRDYRLPRPTPFAAHPILRAVDHVSFALLEGESVGLVGESGCGKSTLTRAILGLDPLQDGSVTLSGQTGSARAADAA